MQDEDGPSEGPHKGPNRTLEHISCGQVATHVRKLNNLISDGLANIKVFASSPKGIILGCI